MERNVAGTAIAICLFSSAVLLLPLPVLGDAREDAARAPGREMLRQMPGACDLFPNTPEALAEYMKRKNPDGTVRGAKESEHFESIQRDCLAIQNGTGSAPTPAQVERTKHILAAEAAVRARVGTYPESCAFSGVNVVVTPKSEHTYVCGYVSCRAPAGNYVPKQRFLVVADKYASFQSEELGADAAVFETNWAHGCIAE